MSGKSLKSRISTLVLAGILGGIVSGFVKLGWEILLPPRTVARGLTNPPQELLQQMGIPAHITHLTFLYSGIGVQWVSLIVHFSFSIVFGIIYCVLAERFPKITIGQGTVFGLVVWVAFHLIIMPAMGTTPPTWKLPFAEDFSEALGHALWMWVIDIFRREAKSGKRVAEINAEASVAK
ncbi:DUF1440 domain-containing protein [Sporolactobacillus shoreae]|uniref:DUF1440 domain-containing protein n=1 Tax=Sporolactobacillus shoreae TaxID=1465501 RepID=A0A4Z0GPU7_9BACL|nr:DUF1440 domain-containing protein [Sporolactobacillus shoreae]TGA98696.1 DUF1440 domain-containing protein [Sporolactobacillus shoreae]